MPKVVHFEIPADNPQRAVKFYQKVFNWKIEKWQGPMDYWFVTTGEDKELGINGAIIFSAAPKAFKRRENLNAINLLNRPFALTSIDAEIEKGHFKIENGVIFSFSRGCRFRIAQKLPPRSWLSTSRSCRLLPTELCWLF